MISLLVAAAIFTYSFPIDQPRQFGVKVVFDGFIPLLGGQEGKVEVNLGMSAKGLPADELGARVGSELTSIEVIFNGAPLNFVTLQSAKDYFPSTQITISPSGQTLKTNAPDLQLPIKLPGLDIKRFPDITFLPLELPKDGAEVGRSYSFKKRFGDNDVTYTVTPTRVDEKGMDAKVTLDQTYEVLENDSVEIVKDLKDATSKVVTQLHGTGNAHFESKLGCFTKVTVSADANSTVTSLETGKKTERKLKTSLEITLKI